MPKASFQPSNYSFEVKPHQNILQAGLNLSLSIPHSCKSGACGACKAKLLEGKVIRSKNEKALSPEEISKGYVLLCCSTIEDDVVIDLNLLPSHIRTRRTLARVEELEKIGDVLKIKFLIPKRENLSFLAGQYLDIILAEEVIRSYSIASAPSDNLHIELHIRYHKGGLFSEFAFNHLKLKDILRIRVPNGSFYIRDTQSPIIFLATGTGFAPIKSILLDLSEKISQGYPKRSAKLYWGEKTMYYIYDIPFLEAFASKNNWFKFEIILSRDPNFNGRKGHVQNLMAQDHSNLSNHEIYACGSPAMTQSALKVALNLGLNEKHFYSDAYFIAEP